MSGAISGVEMFEFDDYTVSFDELLDFTPAEPLVLVGDSGNDTLEGGSLNDILIGHGGDNVLTGGAGADQFVFSRTTGTNIVTDFDIGEDQLDFSRLMSRSSLSRFKLDGEQWGEMGCFGERLFTQLDFYTVQRGLNTEIFVSALTSGEHVKSSEPLVTWVGVDASSLSFDDFVF